MKKILTLAFMALLVLIPLTALAHEDDHAHADTGGGLEEAGFTPEQVAIIEDYVDHEVQDLGERIKGEPDGHGHGGEGFWSETWELLTDPAHWVIEAAAELAFLSFNLIIFDRLIHRHRQGKHTLDGDV